MNSGLFKLNGNDFVKGLTSAVFAGVVFAFAAAVSQPGFDVFNAEWGAILSSALNAALSAFVGYIGKNFVSDSNGAVLGKFGGNK